MHIEHSLGQMQVPDVDLKHQLPNEPGAGQANQIDIAFEGIVHLFDDVGPLIVQYLGNAVFASQLAGVRIGVGVIQRVILVVCDDKFAPAALRLAFGILEFDRGNCERTEIGALAVAQLDDSGGSVIQSRKYETVANLVTLRRPVDLRPQVLFRQLPPRLVFARPYDFGSELNRG